VGRPRARCFLCADVLLLPVGAYLSFVLRLDSFSLGGAREAWAGALVLAGLTVALGPLAFHHFGVYARYWPDASLDDLWALGGAALVVSALVAMFWWALPASVFDQRVLFPRSVPVLLFFLMLSAAGVPRLAARLLAGRRHAIRHPLPALNTLIVGAGASGTRTLAELRRHGEAGLRVVGFLDDDPAKQGTRLHDVPVLGGRHALPAVVRELGVARVIIAIPSASGGVIRELTAACRTVGIAPQLVPGLGQLLDGRVTVNRLRPVQIEDLLRRERLAADLSAVSRVLRGRRVLVTGAGGSIGSELCRQILQLAPAELVLLGHGEHSIFTLHRELEQLLASSPARLRPATRLHAVIADVCAPPRLHAVFQEHRPEVVFHAAAHKHVPLMELNPTAAADNNVLGTRNVVAAARQVGVERFVLVSTDKAINPRSVMGATKRAAELVVHRAALQSDGRYLVVRFGNVLGSRGSVLRTMEQQIAAGGPVTVTDPRMTRYFMTIPEAVQLLLQAAALGRGGEVFVFDMGEPVRILDLAEDLIRLSGLRPGEDVEIVFTGIRPGEKLHEQLRRPGERYLPTAHARIFVAANPRVSDGIEAQLRAVEVAVRFDDTGEVVRALQALVPEYSPPELYRTVPSSTAKSRLVLAPPSGARDRLPLGHP